MKFSVLQQDLLPGLQSVGRSVGVRSTLPVLDNILLSLEGSNLKIAATNLEIGVIKFIPVKVAATGELTVPAKVLTELVAGLGPGQIEFEAAGEILNVKSNKLKASINGIAGSEFPVIPLSSGKGVEFPKEVLQGCGEILFAAAVDEGRPVLTGILTDVKDHQIDFVATDGFRLAHRQVQLPKGTKPFRSLIPRRTFEELLRVMAEEEVASVDIAPSQNQNQVVFTLGKTTVSSRLIEGNFPAWEKIIPANASSRAILDKEELLKALKLAAVFAKNEANVLVVNVGSNQLTLSSQTQEVGTQENEVEAKVEGEVLQIAFNTKFLQDAVSNAPSSQLTMEFSGALQPALIKPAGVKGLQFIIMPVRQN